MRMNISVPDELAEEVRQYDVPISAVCQRALREEVTRLQAIESHGHGQMSEITVEVGEPSLPVGFTGRWLIEPDSDETRTDEDGYDAGAYWGIALTQRGRIAVYTAHCNDRWPPQLRDYDSLDQAANDRVPAVITAAAAIELGERRVIWRDI